MQSSTLSRVALGPIRLQLWCGVSTNSSQLASGRHGGEHTGRLDGILQSAVKVADGRIAAGAIRVEDMVFWVEVDCLCEQRTKGTQASATAGGGMQCGANIHGLVEIFCSKSRIPFGFELGIPASQRSPVD